MPYGHPARSSREALGTAPLKFIPDDLQLTRALRVPAMTLGDRSDAQISKRTLAAGVKRR